MANSKLEKIPYPILKLMALLTSKMPKTILGFRYWRWTGSKINWDKPKNLQEFAIANMIEATKDKPLLRHYGDLADKIKVREYVKERIGKENVLPQLYGTWDCEEDIDWSSLPDKFVLKTNNGCGTNILVRDKSKLDIEATKAQLKKWLRFPYGELSGQVHYAQIRPRILAEELYELKGEGEKLPQDYKFFCFDGMPRFILYYEDRKVNGHVTPNMAFDMDWQPIANVVKRPISHKIKRPASLSQMIAAAKALSAGLPFARIDFYDINGECRFGEVTLTPDVNTYFTAQAMKDFMAYIQ